MSGSRLLSQPLIDLCPLLESIRPRLFSVFQMSVPMPRLTEVSALMPELTEMWTLFRCSAMGTKQLHVLGSCTRLFYTDLDQ